VTGICEFVLSGHRVKVHVPKEGVTVAFSPSGVRAPQRGQLASRDGRAATEVSWLCLMPKHAPEEQAPSSTTTRTEVHCVSSLLDWMRWTSSHQCHCCK